MNIETPRKRQLAQAYYRLGVSRACYVVLKHQAAGQTIVPDPSAIVKDYFEQDLAESISHDVGPGPL
jgi:hypothetical protein